MRYWIGVVGTRESRDRLVAGVDTWWCVSEKAAAGDLIAMYLTRAVAEKGSGVFAVFRITAIDTTRKDECRAFGSAVGGTFHFFALITPLSRVATVVTLDAFRKDATLYRTQFVRRNAQGTLFELTEKEFRRLELLSSKVAGAHKVDSRSRVPSDRDGGSSAATSRPRSLALSSDSATTATKSSNLTETAAISSKRTSANSKKVTAKSRRG
jgi:hypothetical protein